MSSIDGFSRSRTSGPLPKSFPELNDLASGTRETSSQLAKVSVKCACPKYRIYYKQTGKAIVVILCGGDKSTQESDIKRAKEIAKQL